MLLNPQSELHRDGVLLQKHIRFPTEDALSCTKIAFSCRRCTFLQKNATFKEHTGAKLKEIAGGFEGSRIKSASVISQERGHYESFG